MKVQVRLFAQAREAAGSSQVTVELPERARASDLRLALAACYPRMALLAPGLLVSVGTEYADEKTLLHADSEIACFPPVSGG